MGAPPAAELVPLSDLRPLTGAEPSRPDDLASLAESVKAHGVLEPLLVRPAANAYRVQYGRRGGRFGWLVIDTRLVEGTGYRGPPPAFHADKAEALAAVPADVPFEVVRGLGRYAAAKLAHVRIVPVTIRELTDDQARELRAFG